MKLRLGSNIFLEYPTDGKLNVKLLFSNTTDIYRSFEGSMKYFKAHMYNFNLHYLAFFQFSKNSSKKHQFQINQLPYTQKSK
jgi:hypothetical protein